MYPSSSSFLLHVLQPAFRVAGDPELTCFKPLTRMNMCKAVKPGALHPGVKLAARCSEAVRPKSRFAHFACDMGGPFEAPAIRSKPPPPKHPNMPKIPQVLKIPKKELLSPLGWLRSAGDSQIL